MVALWKSKSHFILEVDQSFYSLQAPPGMTHEYLDDIHAPLSDGVMKAGVAVIISSDDVCFQAEEQFHALLTSAFHCLQIYKMGNQIISFKNMQKSLFPHWELKKIANDC